MRCILLVGALLGAFGVASSAFAQRVAVSPPEGNNWRQYAQSYLIGAKNGQPLNLINAKISRCIKANNYGCIWQPRSSWEGTPGPKGVNGAHDGAGGNNGHAIFSHPKWSLVASMRWFERRTQNDREPMTALQLAEIYLPWCDTLGSHATRVANGREWGRSCKDGEHPKVGFSGPVCQRPPNGAPAAGQCQACNCPNITAATWLKTTNLGIDDKLDLFDENGRPTQLLQSIIAWKSVSELGGYRPRPELLIEAAAEFRPEFQPSPQ